MKQASRLLFLTIFGIVLYGLGFFGVVGFSHFIESAFPEHANVISKRVMYSLAFFSGLGLVMLPFYTLAYFHETKHSEVLGYKTPNSQKKPHKEG